MAAAGQVPCYPISTRLRGTQAGAGGWGILVVNLSQRVYPSQGWLEMTRGWRLRRQLVRWRRVSERFGWSLHPYLLGRSGEEDTGRRFNPGAALCPSTHDALLGESFGPDTPARLMRRRIDRFDAGCPHSEPLLMALERRADNWLGTDLELLISGGPRRRIRFRITWADLWLFPDQQGVSGPGNALLALKVEPVQVESTRGPRACRVGDLADLLRCLRIVGARAEGPHVIEVPEVSTTAPVVGDAWAFWPELLSRWLGVELDARDCVAQDSARMSWERLLAWLRRSSRVNALLLGPGEKVWADRYTSYAKCLAAARIDPPDAAGETAWGCPLTEPALGPDRVAQERADGLWSTEQSAWAQASAEDVPTHGDVLLYELAALLSEGGVLGGRNQGRDQVNLDYVRSVMAGSGIEIWEHWRGLALRDCCAFLAWHPRVPILLQAEARYYPLYLHAYYLQIRLHDFSEAIIQHELNDLAQARRIQQVFMEFRNQFWFREPATGFQGVAVAEAMHAGMGLAALYDSVATEIAEVGDYVDRKAAAGRQQIITTVLLLFFPVTFLWDLSLKDWTSERLAGVSAVDLALSLAWTLLVVGLILRLFGKRLRRFWNRLRADYFFRDF